MDLLVTIRYLWMTRTKASVDKKAVAEAETVRVNKFYRTTRTLYGMKNESARIALSTAENANDGPYLCQ